MQFDPRSVNFPDECRSEPQTRSTESAVYDRPKSSCYRVTTCLTNNDSQPGISVDVQLQNGESNKICRLSCFSEHDSKRQSRMNVHKVCRARKIGNARARSKMPSLSSINGNGKQAIKLHDKTTLLMCPSCVAGMLDNLPSFHRSTCKCSSRRHSRR